MEWHIDCPFNDQAYSGPDKMTLQPEFVTHMGTTHGTPSKQATDYFNLNCHQIPVPV